MSLINVTVKLLGNDAPVYKRSYDRLAFANHNFLSAHASIPRAPRRLESGPWAGEPWANVDPSLRQLAFVG